MDHRQFLQSLSSEQRQKLTRKSDRIAFANLAIHGGAIVLVSLLIINRVFLWPLLLVVQGMLVIFLFTLLHETIHRTAFATRQFNDIAAWVCGLLILIPPRWFRYFHFAHHRYTQDPQNDPELATPKPATRLEYVIHLSGIPVWIGQLRTMVQNARGVIEGNYVPTKGHRKVISEARGFLAIYALAAMLCVLLSSTELLYLWLLPILLGQPFLRIYLLAEHAGCPQEENMFSNTRTVLTNAVVRRFAWNMPYHTEHHSYPNVPFHQLDELHQLIKENLQHRQHGYLRFNRYFLRQL